MKSFFYFAAVILKAAYIIVSASVWTVPQLSKRCSPHRNEAVCVFVLFILGCQPAESSAGSHVTAHQFQQPMILGFTYEMTANEKQFALCSYAQSLTTAQASRTNAFLSHHLMVCQGWGPWTGCAPQPAPRLKKTLPWIMEGDMRRFSALRELSFSSFLPAWGHNVPWVRCYFHFLFVCFTHFKVIL